MVNCSLLYFAVQQFITVDVVIHSDAKSIKLEIFRFRHLKGFDIFPAL